MRSPKFFQRRRNPSPAFIVTVNLFGPRKIKLLMRNLLKVMLRVGLWRLPNLIFRRPRPLVFILLVSLFLAVNLRLLFVLIGISIPRRRILWFRARRGEHSVISLDSCRQVAGDPLIVVRALPVAVPVLGATGLAVRAGLGRSRASCSCRCRVELRQRRRRAR